MREIDLRSDTVTRPTAAMREAIARAEVGDDVYGEDPSVNRLQELAAERLGKPAALFVPSGSMANQLALRAHTEHGDAVIAGTNAHLYLYEGGAAGALSGVQFTFVGEEGLFDADDVRGAIHPRDSHFARTRLVCVENTHNRSGGRVFPLEQLRAVAEAAREEGLSLHLDGARIFNAEVATGVPAAVWAEPFDSVAFCLSKGLGAPVGSLIVGTRSFIERVHRFRKMFGGGMRQAGILAAAGSYALEHHVKRLAEDHANARRLAEGLERIPGVALLRQPETNMVLFQVPDVAAFVERTRGSGLLINPIDPVTLRAVLHLDVEASDVQVALEIIGKAVA
ncbi:MAG: low-specificity L-threonine aldolase [Myxococcales bacterium]|nr:low-specificity L-threonine aldolase [Myxococcales bacterium]MCZ6713497.1 low-specificity L-threonine aldolase [Deltaproteobacteria bacterium]TDI97216.1 MAG: low-specificity L-threonine aldolase [Deltaproteobacteria bacterium]TDJ07301.1 MAG: low-specificity L-threonine aldolase [Deltaproteobacteria bacterium]